MPRSPSTSLVWPIVLILIGILALALPVATSFGVARVLSWLLFFDGIIQLFYAFKSEGVGRIVWKVLASSAPVCGRRHLLTLESPGWNGRTHPNVSRIFLRRRDHGSAYLLVRFEEQRGALAATARHCHTAPGRDDLAPMAAEFTLGGGNPRRRLHPVEWGHPPSSRIGHASTSVTPGEIARRCAGTENCARYSTNAGSCVGGKIGNGGASSASVKRRYRSAASGSGGCGQAGMRRSRPHHTVR